VSIMSFLGERRTARERRLASAPQLQLVEADKN